jgi:hypothetical protein
MISEGVDIPRAACLAWLTAYRTPLFFAQAVGRVVRARRRGESATVFLPAVRPLLTLAAELEAERGHVLRAAPPGEELDPPVAPEDQPGLAQWEALEAEASFAHVLHGGRAVLGDEGIRPATDDEEDFLGLPGLLSPQQTADLLSRRDADLRARLATVPDRPAEDPAEGAWQRTGALRREVNALVAQVAARTGQPHGAVHAAVRSAVPGPASASAGAALLAARRDHLLGLR